MLKADYLTIGKKLADTLSLIDDNDYLEKLGKDFCEFVNYDARRVLKWLNFDTLGLQVLRFGMEREDVKNSKTILIRSNESQVKARIINGYLGDSEHEPFFIQDMFCICKDFIVLDGLESMSAGAAKRQLEEVLSYINIPVIIQAGYLYYGDYETVDECKESYDLLDKLCEYYKGIGFVDVNKYIGCYDESVIMLKANPEFINKVMYRSASDAFNEAIALMSGN